MKVMYHPQVSMRSYEHQRWHLMSDAQLTKMRAYVDNLPVEWKWYWLLPESWQCELMDFRVVSPPNVYAISTPHMDNVLEERFNFPMRDLWDVYADVRPDLLICEIPEHVRAWRAVQDKCGHVCPIIAMVEHVDFYDETKMAARVPFFLRQLDGGLAADKVVFPLDGMKHEWWKYLDNVSLDGKMAWAPLVPKFAVWPGQFSPKEVDEQREAGRAMRVDGELYGNEPIVFLISRLSDPSRTMYEEIIGASNDLYRDGVEHILWVANPNEARTWDWIKHTSMAYEPHPFGEKRLGREEYLQLLHAADVVPIAYDLSRIYSVGACEASAADCVVISDAHKYEGGLRCEKVLEERDRLGITKALYQVLRGGGGAFAREFAEAVSVEENLEVVRRSIEELVHPEVTA